MGDGCYYMNLVSIVWLFMMNNHEADINLVSIVWFFINKNEAESGHESRIEHDWQFMKQSAVIHE